MLEIVILILACTQFIMWAYFQTQINILNYKINQKNT